MSSSPTPEPIDRREALRRAALLLGGVVSASTVAAVLAGCEAAPVAEAGWKPRALSDEQGALVATIAEHIIPETDTPGARGVGVHRFIDTMLAEYHSPEQRARFLDGLRDVDARARAATGKTFLRSSAVQQRDVLARLDKEAYPQARPAQLPFFRVMKELTLVGYYTSQAGATRELRHVAIPGRYEGCVPRTRIERAWAV
jgi:hypothetical protein